jgi:PAS domain S-box-containing protein
MAPRSFEYLSGPRSAVAKRLHLNGQRAMYPLQPARYPRPTVQASRATPASFPPELILPVSETGALLRSTDWSKTPLGPVERWPQSLRIAAGICLNSRFPMFIWWGPQLIYIYNDAHIPILGKRHPRAFGRPAQGTWSDIWPVVGPQAEAVMRRGEATWSERILLVMERHGYKEDTWFTYSYSPIPDEQGGIGGLFCATVEETPRVLVERERDGLLEEARRVERRHRFLLELDEAVRSVTDPAEITACCARLLGEYLQADRCAYADVEDDEDTFNLTGDYNRGVPSIVGRYRFADFGAEVLHLMREDKPYVVADVDTHEPPIGDLTYYRKTLIQSVICVPLRKGGRFVAAMAVHQKTPRVWRPEEIDLMRTVASRCWESIERARVERTLRESEARFRQLADAMPQIVFAATPDGHVDYFNRQWYEYTGLPEGEVGYESWRQAHTEDGLRRTSERWNEALRTGEPYEIEYALRRHDGAYRWHLGRALPIRDRNGRVVRWFGTNTDIHERKTFEQSLQDARAEAERASRMKDEFLATLSHELRTPLNAIFGWAQILKMRAALPAELAQGVEVIERNARAQGTIIADLLDMSAIVSGKVRLDMQRTDLAEVVRAAVETARPAAAAKQIGLHVRLEPEAGAVISGDANRLQQVLWNLLSNAVKYTPNGGRIDVDLARAGSDFRLCVADTGEGIHPDFLPFIFDRFRQADATKTRRHAGLGLGLSIVKQLVELHGGTVVAVSAGPDRGASFIVTLPEQRQAETVPASQSKAPADGLRPAAPAGAPRIAGLKVLVVDDDRDARDLVRRLLEDERAAVTTAQSAREAAALLESDRFDVLVSDIGMPDEDGYALMRRVRAFGAQRGGDIPAIALSAYARPEDRVEAVRAGFQMHLAKPVEPTELLAMVASVAKRL